MHTTTLQHGLKRSIKKFFAFIALHHITFFVEQYLFERVDDVGSGLSSDENCPSAFAEHVNTGEQISHTVVEKREVG